MPTFPFKRSPGQDLRDLFAHDRLRAQANDLGYSSLGPGEGSFDIVDAAGNVIALSGHHAGKAGFLVPDGSGWQTVQEAAAAEVTAGTAAIVERLDSHASRIGAAEGRLDSHAGRLGAVEGDVAGHSGRLDSHASRLGAVEGVNSTQTGRLDAHVIRIGRAEDEIDKVITALNALKVRVGDLDGGSKTPVSPNPKG